MTGNHAALISCSIFFGLLYVAVFGLGVASHFA